MKNSQNNFRIFVVALVALFSVAFTSAAHAGEGTGNFPVNVKYLGAVNKAPIFQLSFTNETVEQFEITIKDKFNTLYTETIKGKGLIRKFQFVNNELTEGSDEDVVIVEIKNSATKSIITYKIHPNTRVEKETELVASL